MIQVIKNMRTGKVHWLGWADSKVNRIAMCRNWAVGLYASYISKPGKPEDITCKICKRMMEKKGV